MAISANVMLWGTRIGGISQENLSSVPTFQYDSNFLKSGIQPSPITMPLTNAIYSFPGLAQNTFHNLPGMLADSLPDKYGSALLSSYLSRQGRSIENISPVERLLYTGSRGMGALEFQPEQEFLKTDDSSLDINELVQLASDILTQRENLHIRENTETMQQILKIGTSAGGARAKAIVAWNPKTKDIRSGQISAGSGYEYWLIKFDNIENNKDKGDKADGKAYTRIEYAYYLMARACGIEMTECQIYKENGAYHFMTRRFDRTNDGTKLHMQSLGALAHFDFNMPGAYGYEQASLVLRELNLGQKEQKQLFLRMVFNIIARNQDDHVKNISFLMDKFGNWSLAPAYDITYAYDPTNRWLARHQMTVNGKTENIELSDIFSVGRIMGLNTATMKSCINQVKTVVSDWSKYAEMGNVPEHEMEEVRENLIL